jgi:hypothetical protein
MTKFSIKNHFNFDISTASYVILSKYTAYREAMMLNSSSAELLDVFNFNNGSN